MPKDGDELRMALKRFGFSDTDYCSDERLRRLVNYKLRLDEQISDAYKALSLRLAKTAGLSEAELSHDPRLMFVLQGIIHARGKIATLHPPKKSTTEAKANAKT